MVKVRYMHSVTHGRQSKYGRPRLETRHHIRKTLINRHGFEYRGTRHFTYVTVDWFPHGDVAEVIFTGGSNGCKEKQQEQ